MTPSTEKAVREALEAANKAIGSATMAEKRRARGKVDAALALLSTPVSPYDEAVNALALIIDGDGWFAWCPEQGFIFFVEHPFEQEANENWRRCWRSYGVEYEISEPFAIPRPEDWRTSLRCIRGGVVVEVKGGE